MALIRREKLVLNLAGSGVRAEPGAEPGLSLGVGEVDVGRGHNGDDG